MWIELHLDPSAFPSVPEAEWPDWWHVLGNVTLNGDGCVDDCEMPVIYAFYGHKAVTFSISQLTGDEQNDLIDSLMEVAKDRLRDGFGDYEPEYEPEDSLN